MSELFQAARATDPIGHGYGMLGILAGVVVGAAIVAAGVVTGGAAIALVIAAGALSGAALANGIQRVAGAKNPWTGNIGFGSTNVRINSLGAARAIMDFATPVCNGLYGVNHFPLLPIPPIAEGSKTVRINGQLAARVTSRLICAADITDGSPNVWIGGPTETVLPVIDIEAILTTVATVVVIGATFMISGPILGAVYVVGGFALSEGINYLANTYIGPGWGGIINGTLGFLALGLGAVFSRRAALRTQAARQSALRNTLRDAVRSDAERLSALPRTERGPVVARATDLKTGRMSDPYTNANEMPADLHPVLRNRAAELENMGDGRPHYSKPGTHAEVLATNELLWARERAGETVTPETLRDIVTDQYWLDPHRGETILNPAKTCPNCTHTLHGTESAAGKKVNRGDR